MEQEIGQNSPVIIGSFLKKPFGKGRRIVCKGNIWGNKEFCCRFLLENHNWRWERKREYLAFQEDKKACEGKSKWVVWLKIRWEEVIRVFTWDWQISRSRWDKAKSPAFDPERSNKTCDFWTSHIIARQNSSHYPINLYPYQLHLQKINHKWDLQMGKPKN